MWRVAASIAYALHDPADRTAQHLGAHRNMALKITATLIVRNGDARKAYINDDPDTAAYEVANYLRSALGGIVPTEDVSVTIQETKRDGTPKPASRTGTYQV